VALLFETAWDRRQLDACRARWEGRVECLFPPPDDLECSFDLDPLAFVEEAASGAWGRLDGVLSASDYPGATLAGAIATRLGLPGSQPERLIAASHKYYSRRIQRRAAPEAVPEFALVDPRRDPPAPLAFPFFLKPVKGAFSVLARRIPDEAIFREFVHSPAVREFAEEYMGIFNRLVAAYTDFEVDGHGFIAEELLSGDLVTVEGYTCDGEVHVIGIVDSILHANRSFARFDYPSALPVAVQERMAGVAERVIVELGLERTLFNIEMTWDAARDRIAIVEVNPRICGQFGDLYQKVDGTNTYEIALALCTGERPVWTKGRGRYAAAASQPLRVFEPMTVEAAPGPAEIAAAESLFPETLVWSECRAGDELADFEVDEDGASHRYAVVNLGGASRDEIAHRCAAVQERLGYRMRPR